MRRAHSRMSATWARFAWAYARGPSNGRRCPLEVVEVGAPARTCPGRHRDDPRAAGPSKERQQPGEQRERPDDHGRERRFEAVGLSLRSGKSAPALSISTSSRGSLSRIRSAAARPRRGTPCRRRRFGTDPRRARATRSSRRPRACPRLRPTRIRRAPRRGERVRRHPPQAGRRSGDEDGPTRSEPAAAASTRTGVAAPRSRSARSWGSTAISRASSIRLEVMVLMRCGSGRTTARLLFMLCTVLLAKCTRDVQVLSSVWRVLALTKPCTPSSRPPRAVG